MPCRRIRRSRIAVADRGTGGCCSCKVYGRAKNRRIGKQIRHLCSADGQPQRRPAAGRSSESRSRPALVILPTDPAAPEPKTRC